MSTAIHPGLDPEKVLIWHTMPSDTESVRVRYDCGQQDTSGQEENRAHFCARFRK
ncbi:MAG: hypothetical protein LBI62_06775 [Candidatus Accumulibacter sp.]|jgi:hypothetical protein|nr:hypothetical protein [Accumulibacter sp.]